jgi:sarcosine oxidase subunit gamma
MSDNGTGIQTQTDLGHLNLRGSSSNPEFQAAVESVLQQDLPLAVNTMTIGDHRVYCLGPNEWQIVASSDKADALAIRLREGLEKLHASVTDQSGGQVAIHVSGARVGDVLAKGCTLDLNSAEFAVGACAQSGLAKASILIGHIDAGPVFEIIVRRSFTDYVLRWLQHAAQDDAYENKKV